MLEALSAKHAHIFKQLACVGTEWHFNSAEVPDFVGLWEAGVKSVKSYLRRVVDQQILTFFDMSILLCKIEAISNSRPMLRLTDDVTDLDPTSTFSHTKTIVRSSETWLPPWETPTRQTMATFYVANGTILLGPMVKRVSDVTATSRQMATTPTTKSPGTWGRLRRGSKMPQWFIFVSFTHFYNFSIDRIFIQLFENILLDEHFLSSTKRLAIM